SRRRAPSKPLLTPRQAREAAGVVLIGAGLLAVVAEVFGHGSLLDVMRRSLSEAFGYGWPLPVAAALFLGGLWIYPDAPRLRKPDVVAALVAALALLGLLALRGDGGSIGATLQGFVGGLAGTWGSAILLLAALVLGLIVAFHFSPGAVLAGAVDTARAAHAERRRIEALVRVKRDPQQPARRPGPARPELEPATAVA